MPNFLCQDNNEGANTNNIDRNNISGYRSENEYINSKNNLIISLEGSRGMMANTSYSDLEIV